MTVDELIRDRLDVTAASQNIVVMPAPQIEVRARHRTNRRRAVTSIMALMAVAGVAIGVGPLLGDSPQERSVFAGQVGDLIPPATPSSIVATADGFVMAEMLWDSSTQVSHTRFKTSSDGIEWQLVDGSGVPSSEAVQLAESDGVFYVLATRDVRTGGNQAYLARSTDLETWQEYELPIESSADGDQAAPPIVRVQPRDLVTSDLGVFARLSLVRGPGLRELIGSDHDRACSIREFDDEIRWRVCGTDEAVVTEKPVESPWTTITFHGQISPAGDGLTFTEMAYPSSSGRIGPPGAWDLYSTGSGVGLTYQNSQPLETDDLVTWDRQSLSLGGGATGAGQGANRLFAGIVAVAGEPEPQVYFKQGEEAVEEILIDELVPARAPGATNAPRQFVNVHEVAPSSVGWLLTVRTVIVPPYMDPAKGDEPVITPIEIEVDAYTFRGHHPYGTAELLDGDGEIVSQWSAFETARPALADGVGEAMVAGERVLHFNAEAPAPVSIPAASFFEAIPAFEGHMSNTVLFSATGHADDWHVVGELEGHVASVALGDEAVVVGMMTAEGPRVERFAVPIN